MQRRAACGGAPDGGCGRHDADRRRRGLRVPRGRMEGVFLRGGIAAETHDACGHAAAGGVEAGHAPLQDAHAREEGRLCLRRAEIGEADRPGVEAGHAEGAPGQGEDGPGLGDRQETGEDAEFVRLEAAALARQHAAGCGGHRACKATIRGQDADPADHVAEQPEGGSAKFHGPSMRAPRGMGWRINLSPQRRSEPCAAKAGIPALKTGPDPRLVPQGWARFRPSVCKIS